MSCCLQHSLEQSLSACSNKKPHIEKKAHKMCVPSDCLVEQVQASSRKVTVNASRAEEKVSSKLSVWRETYKLQCAG